MKNKHEEENENLKLKQTSEKRDCDYFACNWNHFAIHQNTNHAATLDHL